SRRPVRLIVFSPSFFVSPGFFLSATAILCAGCAVFAGTAFTWRALGFAGVLGANGCRATDGDWDDGPADWPVAGVGGFDAFAGEPAKAAFESICFFCTTAFIVFLVFSMRSGFCAEAVPASIPRKTNPVVRFISSPTFSPSQVDRVCRHHLPAAPGHG